MLPQHGGVPNFSMRMKGPVKLLLSFVIFFGLMLTLMFYLDARTGDIEAELHTKQALMGTILLTSFILIGATCRWWHPHLWQHGNSQRHHRKRTKRSRKSGRRRKKSTHGSHRHRM